MTEIVLFGIGSPLVVEYEETCKRRGVPIAAAVKNVAGRAYVGGDIAIVGADAIPARVREYPCLCPIFTPRNRRFACEEAAAAGFHFAAALVDPTAIVASSCTIGDGSFVNAGCVIGAWSRFSEHVVVNRGATIGHDVELGAFVSLGPSVVVCGNVTIGSGALVGAGAIVLPSVRIGANALVAAGSVVARDVPAGAKPLFPVRGGAGAAIPA